MDSILALARRLLALSQTGLSFTPQEYDRERYREIIQIATALLQIDSGRPADQLQQAWFVEDGYATPKIDVRGAIFRDDRVLLVRETTDGKWALPGGWADVNDGPAHAVEKEIEQESGFTARAVKLAALYDRNMHDHLPHLYHSWKAFFICEIVSGEPRTSHETDGVDFFALNALPELSLGRVTAAQIQRMYEHHQHREWPTEFD
ncbi:MAG TPA: NUDIX hydrolase N-terminal domain-containing protein [Steroidobacteraceae bacterium]